ncbi:hypothetical protein PR003_g26439 [Phytophthora rubi]|uniref:Uncharacterized protein n=1 Tax=Phytophthora rubi TaxID=129364 RepID=A0A6A4CC19_9STRA|nr:hypothetical protein PR002_g25354 [Phytophthora rubi]KAE8977675.1 hypothetical protein PR001_g25060 [Phytophthora rubi]KAE9285987.1 hypothetical protein PR003_g26439 [Phytophthora rubi]
MIQQINTTKGIWETDEGVDEENPPVASALWWASRNGCPEVVKALLDEGISINEAGIEGWTPLAIAAFEGHTSVVALLAERGASLNTQVSSGATALIIACGMGHLVTVDILLSNGALIDLASADHWTPLLVASRNNHHDVVALLLFRGAQVDLKGPNGSTALYVAGIFSLSRSSCPREQARVNAVAPFPFFSSAFAPFCRSNSTTLA